MNIKIITITDDDSNYGNSLQNYAVKKILENFNHSVETIKTEYYHSFKKISKENIKIFAKILLKHGDYQRTIRRIKFSVFSNRYLSRSKITVEEKNPKLDEACDCLVFGSDQIWNFTWGGRLCENIDYFTGGFSPNTPKISYSASVGADYIPDKYKERFIENVSRFKAISVREDKAKEIVEDLLDKDVVVTIDPTLMLDKSHWMKIAKKPKYIKKQKYILTYFLREISHETNRLIQTISDKFGLEVINLCSEQCSWEKIKNPKHVTTDPCEFIWLVANCQLMLTDSFHACVFSILMDKPFRCFERIEDGVESMSSRMDTLFHMFSIDDWCVGDVNEDIDHIFYKDYSKVESVLKEKRQFALDYLKKALDNNET